MTHQAVNSLIRRCRRPCAIPVASIWPTEAQICGPYAIISAIDKDDGRVMQGTVEVTTPLERRLRATNPIDHSPPVVGAN